MRKAELIELAESNGVEIAEGATVAQITDALNAAGVAIEEPEAEPVADEPETFDPESASTDERLTRLETALGMFLRGESSAAVEFFEAAR